MPYRIVVEHSLLNIPLYIPQEFDTKNNRWRDLEWGFEIDAMVHREWAFTLKGAKRKIEEWKQQDKDPVVVWKEENEI